MNNLLSKYMTLKLNGQKLNDDFRLSTELSPAFTKSAFYSEDLYIDRLTPHGYRVIEYKDERITKTFCRACETQLYLVCKIP